MHIIVDVDDVVRDTTLSIVNIYNTKYHAQRPVTMDKITDYRVLEQLPKLQARFHTSEAFFRFYSEQLFKLSPDIPGALSAIHNLKEAGHTIAFATSQYRGLEHLTCEWLRANNVTYDDLIFTWNKGQLRGDYMVDDRPKNFIGFEGKKVLFARPWNMNESITDVVRLHSWPSVEKYIDEGGKKHG